jgi:hypothetical protein
VSALSAVRGTNGHVGISFSCADPDSDVIGATASFLDGGGAVIGAAIPLAVGVVYGTASFPFVGDLGASPTAVKVRVTVTDTAGGAGNAEATITPGGGGGTGTDVPAGNVGAPGGATWTLAGSPYRIQGNIQVPKGSKLTIEPGVEVIFQGQFWLRLHGGVTWKGNALQHIVFTTPLADRIAAEGGTRTESTWVGWRGVRIAADISGNGIDHGPGLYDVEYCEFNYVDKGGQVGGDPYEDDVGNFFANGYDATDLVLDHVELHHGRTSLIRLSPHLNAPAGAYTYRGIVGTHHVPKVTNGFAAFDVAHVHTSSGGTGHVDFVGGSISSSSTLASSPAGAIVDVSEAIVNLQPGTGGAFSINGCSQASCGKPAEWFTTWLAGDQVNWP